jgi:hypothetical protein
MRGNSGEAEAEQRCGFKMREIVFWKKHMAAASNLRVLVRRRCLHAIA